MPCYKPLKAYKTPTGKIIFYDSPGVKEFPIPCQRCIGCRLDKSKEWAMRCMHEASLHDQNSFITLTYNDKNLPYNTSLVKEDVQKFFKRLRKRIQPKKIRYYYCGEYGDKNGRPHYHILLFGYNYPDWVRLPHKSPSGRDLYTSPILEKDWKLGFVQIGDVTYESAAYTARYIMKKVMGKGKDEIDPKTGLKPYERYAYDELTGEVTGIHEILPEYTSMSRGRRSDNNGGIGYRWHTRYSSDTYKDSITVNGFPNKVPRYYDQLLQEKNPDLADDIKAQRALKAYESTDNSPDRLKAREKVAKAKTTKLTRSL